MNIRSLLSQGARQLLVLGVCAMAFSAVQAQELKVGYINSERIMRESAPAKAAEAKLEGEMKRRETELRDMQARLKSAAESFDRDVPKLSEADRIKRQRELVEMDQDFQRKQRAFREDYMQKRNEEMSVVFEKVNKAIKKVAESEKYDLIVSDVVYVSPRLDITEKILKAIGN